MVKLPSFCDAGEAGFGVEGGRFVPAADTLGRYLYFLVKAATASLRQVNLMKVDAGRS